MDRKPLIQSVERALEILDLVGDSEHPIGSTQIAQMLNLHVSTTNNLIRTLFRKGYLNQTNDGKYHIGLQCYSLGSLCDRWGILRDIAQIHIAELSDKTGDNSVLASESGGRLITIASAEGSGAIVISNQHLFRDHLHCTAVGKLLMAHSTAEFITLLKKTRPLQRFTEKTITDWESLTANLQKIKDLGYSVNRGEGLLSVAAVAVPVLDAKGHLVCALGQSFPDYFIETKQVNLAERIELVSKYARLIGKDYCDAFKHKKGIEQC